MLQLAELQTEQSANLGLEIHGLEDLGTVHWNLPTPILYEHAVRNGEGLIAENGPLVVHTGIYTGRSPRDKHFVEESSSVDAIWWGEINQPISEANFEALYRQVVDYYRGRYAYILDAFGGADRKFRLPIRVINAAAWHNLFARTMFIPASGEEIATHRPEFTIIHAPDHEVEDYQHYGLKSPTFIVINLAKKLILIGGTQYAGEMKKAIFTILNYLLPKQGVISMHCSANYGADKSDVALFFGMSGTGKTTLSTDPARTFIGDDEHGWGHDGVFNFEGGSYAKVIRLDPVSEPEIYAQTRRFGTVLENVVIDADTRALDLHDATYTENTRAAYPIAQMERADLSGMAGHPKNIIFLTADAFGVLPPVARLTPEQAMYQFISGYTAKVAGTERGVTEPQATFSACFGAPFLPLHPTVYADILRDKLNRHGVQVWLVNTGWTGGPFGTGARMSLKYTRAIVRAILSGQLGTVCTTEEPIFGLHIPVSVPEVPAEVLNPRNTWADKAAYDAKAVELAGRFKANFEKFADHTTPEVLAAGPRI